jgi:hypothetical protein
VEFKTPYLLAMRERDPQLFNALRRNGEMNRHLQQKSEQAHQLLEEILKHDPKPSLPKMREAEEIVLATLIEFPADNEREPSQEPPQDLPTHPGQFGRRRGR